MIVVALAQQKGGVGKSAASINLACQAVEAGAKTALVDMDMEQGTTSKWGERRKDKTKPAVLTSDGSDIDAVLAALKASGTKWVFLDLPGRAHPRSGLGMKAADLIIVPCRPLDVDIEASLSTIEGAKRVNRPYAYLMNIAPNQADKKRAKTVASFLRAAGHPVADAIIVQRVEVPEAMADGDGVNEAKPNSASAKEYFELFQWVKANAGGKK
jgi:chromosome partitioning protein